MQPDTFAAVHAKLAGQPDRRGHDHHADCPFCGKPAKRGQTHFSYSAAGYFCFICGASGGLEKLAEHLGNPVAPVRSPAPKPKPRPKTPPSWLADADRYVWRYTAHPRRMKLWQSYKPLTRDAIERHRLGVGVFPKYASRCRHERLMVPLIEAGKIVGLRGRGLGCDCPKWLTAAGSETILFGDLERGSVVWVVENIVDAVLVGSLALGYSAVASSSGVAAWRDEWTARIADARPEMVIVAFDNDEAGQRYGPKVANALLRAGVRARLFEWPEGTPAKADIGGLFARREAA